MTPESRTDKDRDASYVLKNSGAVAKMPNQSERRWRRIKWFMMSKVADSLRMQRQNICWLLIDVMKWSWSLVRLSDAWYIRFVGIIDEILLKVVIKATLNYIFTDSRNSKNYIFQQADISLGRKCNWHQGEKTNYHIHTSISYTSSDLSNCSVEEIMHFYNFPHSTVDCQHLPCSFYVKKRKNRKNRVTDVGMQKKRHDISRRLVSIKPSQKSEWFLANHLHWSLWP